MREQRRRRLYRKLFMILLLLALLPFYVRGGIAQKQTIKKDPIFPDRWNIYQDGRQVGEIRPDPIFPGKYNVYDMNGKKSGGWKKDPIDDQEWRCVGEQ